MCFRTVVDERKLVPWAQEVLGQRDDQLNNNVNTLSMFVKIERNLHQIV